MQYGLEKKHIRAFNLILVILLGISLGNLFSAASSFYLHRQEPPLKLSGNQENVKVRRAGFQSYQPILQLNFFDPAGRHQPGSTFSQKQSQETQPQTVSRKDLILVGTVTSSERPFAVILVSGEEHIVHLKEELPDGSTLEKINREEVWFRDRNGTLFSLTLPTMASSEPEPQPQPPGQPDQAVSSGIKKVGENRWIISSQEAQKARENIGVLMRQARLEPHLVNGKVEGFAVRMIRPRTLLWELGLKRGDVLREINGVPLDGPEKGLEIFQQLQEARNVSIGLERRGQNFTFEYEIE